MSKAMLNPRQEKFISLYASGQTAAAAYAEAYGRRGRSVRMVEKDSPLAILGEMARLLCLGQRPAKSERAHG